MSSVAGSACRLHAIWHRKSSWWPPMTFSLSMWPITCARQSNISESLAETWVLLDWLSTKMMAVVRPRLLPRLSISPFWRRFHKMMTCARNLQTIKLSALPNHNGALCLANWEKLSASRHPCARRRWIKMAYWPCLTRKTRAAITS